MSELSPTEKLYRCYDGKDRVIDTSVEACLAISPYKNGDIVNLAGNQKAIVIGAGENVCEGCTKRFCKKRGAFALWGTLTKNGTVVLLN